MQGESQQEGKWFGSSKGCTATPHPALSQPRGFGGQGRITEALQPCPPQKRASKQVQTELPTELVSFLQCPDPAGSGLHLCWLRFVHLKLRRRTGAWHISILSSVGWQLCRVPAGHRGLTLPWHCSSSCCSPGWAGAGAGAFLEQVQRALALGRALVGEGAELSCHHQHTRQGQHSAAVLQGSTAQGAQTAAAVQDSRVAAGTAGWLQ